MAAKTPDECDKLFAEAMNRGDGEAVVALYEDGATLYPDPAGGPVVGKDGIRAALGGFLAMKPQFDLKPTTVAQAGDIAVVYGDWSGSGTAPDGTNVPMEGKSIEVVRRQADGSWKFIFDDPFGRSKG